MSTDDPEFETRGSPTLSSKSSQEFEKEEYLTLSQIWRAAQTGLKNRLAPHAFDNWIKPIEGMEVNGQLNLIVPSYFHAQWIQDNYYDLLCTELQTEFNFEIKEVGKKPHLRLVPGGPPKAPSNDSIVEKIAKEESFPSSESFSKESFSETEKFETGAAPQHPPMSPPMRPPPAPNFPVPGAGQVVAKSAAGLQHAKTPARVGVTPEVPKTPTPLTRTAEPQSQVLTNKSATAVALPATKEVPPVQKKKPARVGASELKNQPQGQPTSFATEDAKVAFGKKTPFINWPGIHRVSHCISLFLEHKDQLQFNPLFLKSSSGMGKTALIWEKLRGYKAQNPDCQIGYVSIPQFAQEMVEAIEKRQVYKFQSRYQKKYDVLVVDDLHFLEGKTKTQTEFLHLLNYYLIQNKPILILSQDWTNDLKINETLKIKLQGGLTLEIDDLDQASQDHIFNHLCKVDRLNPPKELVALVQERPLKAVANLVSLVTQLRVHKAFTNTWPGKKTFLQWLRPHEKDMQVSTIESAKIVDSICERFKMTLEELKGKSRKKTYRDARQTLVVLLREIGQMSYQDIGKVIGRHHTSIMSTLDGAKKRCQTDPVFQRQIQFLKDNILEN